MNNQDKTNTTETSVGTIGGEGELFRSLADGAQVGFYVTDANGNYQYANPYWLSLTGLRLDETVGNGWKKALYPDDREMVLSNWDKVVETGGSWRGEFRFQKPDGQVVWIYGLVDPQRNAVGEISMFAGMNVDVTVRKEAEIALKKSEDELEALITHMQEGIAYCKMIYDENNVAQDFIYLRTNPAFERVTGLKNVDGKKVSEVIPGLRQSQPELFEIYSRVALTGADEIFESYIKDLSLWFSISVYSPQKGYFAAIVRPITEMKKREAAMKNKVDELEKINKLMVGRELEMVELKGKIAELEAKLANQ